MSKSMGSSPYLLSELHQDCLVASANQSQVTAGLTSKRISMTGGTGFMGSWVAQMVCALNDEYRLNISLDLYARNIGAWSKKYPHLSGRKEIHLRSQDVRSPFEFEKDTNFIIHAAGIPDNRIHASDPWRVQQTTVLGTANALDAANQLTQLEHFINLSSCLVNGTPNRSGALAEEDCFPITSGKLHRVYVDAKRSSESLSAIYRSQFRLPISTLRPFTFIGPYQELDRPWAINSFLNDAIIGRDIRIHGDGSARRSYLYGSDVAFWILAALIRGHSGGTYNLGSAMPVAHSDLVGLICDKTALRPKLSFNTAPSSVERPDDLFPNTALSMQNLGVQETCNLEQALDKTWRWNTAK
jgi:dTDP-glucose 4,6-dehydratase